MKYPSSQDVPSDDCRPPRGLTYLAIGQDLFSINEYIMSQYNFSLHSGSLSPITKFTPAAAMVYTSIASVQNGTSLPTDYGSGIEYADGILNSLFPNQDIGLQIGLWLEGSEGCVKIISGEMDEEIALLVQYLETCKASKIFLRIGYEFDNPSFGYSKNPSLYRKAFKTIVESCRQKLSHDALTKIFFVWHSWAAPRAKDVTLDDFYPGDDYVHWIGISVFQQVYPWSTVGGTMQDIKEVLDFAELHGKPTMIAESTPFGSIGIPHHKNYPHLNAWDLWFQQIINLINKYDIGLWSYINSDWDSMPMWHGVGFGETRISTNELVMKKWQEMVVSSQSRFLLAGSLTSCGKAIGNDNVPETYTMLEATLLKNNEYARDQDASFGNALLFIGIASVVFPLVFLAAWFQKRYKNSCFRLSRNCARNEETIHFPSAMH